MEMATFQANVSFGSRFPQLANRFRQVAKPYPSNRLRDWEARCGECKPTQGSGYGEAATIIDLYSAQRQFHAPTQACEFPGMG